MKKHITFLLKTTLLTILISTFSILTAQTNRVNFENNWGKQGLSVKSNKANGLVINSSITSYDMIPTTIEKNTLQTITTDGVYLQNDEGAPNVPGFSKYIAIPQGATVTAKIVNISTELFNNIDVAPSPVIPKDNDKNPLVYNYNNQIYSSDALYPKEIIQLSEPLKIRGMDVVLIAVSPFQYNPITDQLVVNKDIEIEISFEGGNNKYGEDRLRNRWWDPIIQDAVINPEVIKEISNSSKGTAQTGCEYLIIVPDDPIFISWADSLKNFRNCQGILTEIMTTTEVGGNTVTAIEGFINNAYNTWDIPPAAVLLMADFGLGEDRIISPIYDNYCASDNIFADVDNDQMPDVIFARMTAQNEEHLETFVTKVINYERNPPTSPDFYNHPITALGWQTERWFQICSETVGGFFKTVHGKDPVRINAVYDGNPDVDPWSYAQNTNTIINYFGPNGLGYIPATPSELGGWANGSASDVNNALNDGAFILQHRDHGGQTGWGEPNYNSNSINGLTNTDLSFIFSINCLTGKYNADSECFTEKFHRYKHNGENSGALGLIAASEVSYSFVNDTYVWGLYDNMWPEFMPDYGTTPDARGILPAFGNAAGKYFLKQSSWPYNTGNKEVTYNLFHHHGDAFSVVYSEVPQLLTVVHDQALVAGEIGFTVTADNGSLIALTVNNVIIGTADGTGSPVVIDIPAQFPPDKIKVTVTKQNYYRYESIVDIIPPSGPYVIYNEVAINNTTGMMTTGESTLANLTVKNIGVEEGQNISTSISTTDEFVTISDNTEEYGNIAAGATASVPDGFAWDVANNIPDLHSVEFNIESTNGTDVWLSKMNIIGHAPVLRIGDMTFDDSAQGNGNGLLDPGEIVTVVIDTYNDGSSKAINTLTTLTCFSAFIEITDNQFTIGDINDESMAIAEFTITVDDATPIGSVVNFEFEAVSGEYTAERTFAKKAGLVVEDWETGTMDKYPWATGGTGIWEISTDEPFEGTYCNKTTPMDDSKSTWMSIIYESAIDDSISFYVNVSSEEGYDFFRFYIDGQKKVSISGEETWQRYSFPVTAGTHLFKWQYIKDSDGSSGDDCAKVDFIILPTPVVTSAFAGNDAEYCESDDILCEGTSTNCESVSWETSGTGSFENANTESTVYLPSNQDISNGSVELTFTGFGPVETVSDVVVITIAASPNVIAGQATTICSDIEYLIEDAVADNYNTLLWSTSGDGTFDDATFINAIYSPGTGDIELGSATLTLTAQGSEACGEVTDVKELTIILATTANAGIDADICPMLTYTISDAEVLNYVNIEWTTSGDGSFDDATIANPTYSPGELDKEEKAVTLTLSATNDLGCPNAVDDMLLTLYCTDISEISNQVGVKLYPNPNNGSFTLKLDGAPNDIANITVYNALGKVVYYQSDVNIVNDFSQQLTIDSQSGVYTINIEGNSFVTNSKFIVK